MKRILILVPVYLPGYKAGGPIRTIANMVEALGDEFEFMILCQDRDLGNLQPYEDVMHNAWNQFGKAKVQYVGPGLKGMLRLARLLNNNSFDVLHLNSFFSFRFSIFPLLIRRVCRLKFPTIVGTRGEFSAGALALKSKKKNLFIKVASILGLHREVTWHASSAFEAQDILRVIGDGASTYIASDISLAQSSIMTIERNEDAPLRIVFVARISAMKNLEWAIRVLASVPIQVDFDVYGPIEDEAFWKHCLDTANRLPSHIKFSYKGALAPELVNCTLSKYDLFFLPSLGENFCHVIAEALFAGLPVLISNRTPWRGLIEKKIGWDIGLESPEIFVKAILECSEKSKSEYAAWRLHIREWALDNVGNGEAVDATRQLFTR